MTRPAKVGPLRSATARSIPKCVLCILRTSAQGESGETFLNRPDHWFDRSAAVHLHLFRFGERARSHGCARHAIREDIGEESTACPHRKGDAENRSGSG